MHTDPAYRSRAWFRGAQFLSSGSVSYRAGERDRCQVGRRLVTCAVDVGPRFAKEGDSSKGTYSRLTKRLEMFAPERI